MSSMIHVVSIGTKILVFSNELSEKNINTQTEVTGVHPASAMKLVAIGSGILLFCWPKYINGQNQCRNDSRKAMIDVVTNPDKIWHIH